MITKCPVCGKGFDILWPHLWAYKEEKRYICSWKCLREMRKEGKGMENKKRDRCAVAEDVISAVKAGKDPIGLLKEMGYANPGQAYSDIRTMLKKTRPDKFAELPENLSAWKKRMEIPKPISGGDWEKMETPEGSLAGAMAGMKDATDEFFGKCKDMGLKVEKPEAARITKPVNYGGFLMDVIRSPETGARYEYKENLLFVKYGPDEFVMEPSAWRKLIDEIPNAAAVLGVEL